MIACTFHCSCRSGKGRLSTVRVKHLQNRTSEDLGTSCIWIETRKNCEFCGKDRSWKQQRCLRQHTLLKRRKELYIPERQQKCWGRIDSKIARDRSSEAWQASLTLKSSDGELQTGTKMYTVGKLVSRDTLNTRMFFLTWGYCSWRTTTLHSLSFYILSLVTCQIQKANGTQYIYLYCNVCFQTVNWCQW